MDNNIEPAQPLCSTPNTSSSWTKNEAAVTASSVCINEYLKWVPSYYITPFLSPPCRPKGYFTNTYAYSVQIIDLHPETGPIHRRREATRQAILGRVHGDQPPSTCCAFTDTPMRRKVVFLNYVNRRIRARDDALDGRSLSSCYRNDTYFSE
ncbi:hypothetical protein SODALDRAFT_348699 [Sodiomyces alkalinus F11]|uniref:Uncharacterized protein n=1 Tax=Sodiomyces alkalinus (strain CBS 110278 / VKM F-3762 / F11) TaxID=1314773 RepID=A0A3N2Q125_SODAK|nr:hypothetical protein SODALDRAFT_348699 [Sodiomyces alkalinus F11]ROT40464.1 hypothetical protein SODALDRAFT_348699 [Sodiomyces alkalinus F11]